MWDAPLRLRGGSWINNHDHCRASNRNNNQPGDRHNNLGFRLVGAASTLNCQNRRKGFRRACIRRVQSAFQRGG